ncbi:MAG: putative holin-like toxin [Peptococcaceae bacterium]|nr:putative holin-like toxin [Peptococcaceae bacterium]
MTTYEAMMLMIAFGMLVISLFKKKK